MGRGLGWVTHRGPFQPRPCCDSVIHWCWESQLSICSSPVGKSRVATAQLPAEWQRSLLHAGLSNGSVPAAGERCFSTKSTGFQHSWVTLQAGVLPAFVHLLQHLGWTLAPRPPRPIREPWSFLLQPSSQSSTERGPQWQRRENGPISTPSPQRLCRAFECRASRALRRRAAPDGPVSGRLALVCHPD